MLPAAPSAQVFPFFGHCATCKPGEPRPSARIVIDPKKVSKKMAQWIEIGAVWSHSDGSGFDLMIPPGISLAGRIVCRQRKE
jgi:hypothetical protein